MASRLQLSRVPIIVCEGPSEENYLTELNKLLVRNSYSVFCKPVSVGTGDFSPVIKKFKNSRQQNRKSEILIWIDRDIYVRNSNKCFDSYSRKAANIPDFLFSDMNFEDFLSLHYSDSEVIAFEKILEKKNHFRYPLTEDSYLPCFKSNLCPEYQKEDLPFVLDKNRLDTMFNNLGKYKMNCGFAYWLKEQLNSGAVTFR